MQLFSQNILLCFQLLNMRDSDVGDNRIIGCGNFRQTAHLAKVAHSHFHHGCFVFGSKSENRQWQSYLTVVIPLGPHDILLRGKCQRDHFLGCRLTDASCHPHHRYGKSRAMCCSNQLQSGKGARHTNPRIGILHLRMFFCQRCHCASSKRRSDVRMRICPFPLDGNE